MSNLTVVISGTFNLKPYYALDAIDPNGGFIFWNSGETRWEHASTLGGTPVLAYLSGQTGEYPNGVNGFYKWITLTTNYIKINTTDLGYCGAIVTPTPTKTPGLSMNPTPTPTKTPGLSMEPTPTPTKTPGLSMNPTPTPTPTKTPGLSMEPTPTVTKTPGLSMEPTPTITPSMTSTQNSCTQIFFVVCKPPSSSAITASASGSTLYNGKPYFKLDNSDMNVVFWDSGNTVWVSSVSGLTGETKNFLNNDNGPLPIAGIDYQWEYECDILDFDNNVVVDSYQSPCITPSVTPTKTLTPTPTKNNCYRYEVFANDGTLNTNTVYEFKYTRCNLTQATGFVVNRGSVPVCGILNSFTSNSQFVGFGLEGRGNCS